MYGTVLDRLIRVAMQFGRNALWIDALPAIIEVCGATGGRLVMDLDAEQVRHSYGLIAHPFHQAIEQWEQSLNTLEDWFPVGRGSLANRPPSHTLHAHHTLPVVHIAIQENSVLIGGLSLIFKSEEMPSASMMNTIDALVQSAVHIANLATERYQLQRRLTQANLLYEVSRAISSSLEINDVLEITTALATNALNAETAALVFVDQKQDEMVFAIVHGAGAERIQQKRLPLNEEVLGWVIHSGQTLLIAQTSPWIQSGWGYHITGAPVRNCVCAPLQVKGETLGVLQVFNKEGDGDFNTEDTDWLVTLASQAAMAIENSRLYTTLREERDRIIQAEDEVRRHLARNLHDSAVQLLGSLLMHIEVTRKLSRAQPENLEPEFDLLRDLAQQAHQELRHALFELRPLLLESRGLIGALVGYVNQLRRSGNHIEISVKGELPEAQNKQAETAVYLIVQEALANVRKHARARRTVVRIAVEPPLLKIEIEDDGDGFALNIIEANYAERGSLGLLNMQERAAWLDGKIQFISPHLPNGKGSLVKVELPISRLTAVAPDDMTSWIITKR